MLKENKEGFFKMQKLGQNYLIWNFSKENYPFMMGLNPIAIYQKKHSDTRIVAKTKCHYATKKEL